MQKAGGYDITLETGSTSWNGFRLKREIKPGMQLPGQVMQLTGAGARCSLLTSLPLDGNTYSSHSCVMAVVSLCLHSPQMKPLTITCVKTCIS